MQFMNSEAVLLGVGEQLVKDVRLSQRDKNLRVSGRSAASTRAEVTADGPKKRLQLFGLARWRFQQSGRGPGKYKWPSKKMVLAIEEWVKARGLSIPAYAIAMKINRDGIHVPNQFNPGGVLSEPLAAKRVTGILKTKLRPMYIQSAKSILFS